MNVTTRTHWAAWACLAALVCLAPASLQAQVTVRLEDDFSDTQIDPTKWVINESGFEATGAANVTIQEAAGVAVMDATATASYWGGASLKTVASFPVPAGEVLSFTVDRVALTRTGTAGRSSMWITDATRERYVMFAQNMGENGWQYNRRIGETGDNATGGGTNIAAFDSLDGDGGNHQMKMVADGKVVKLFLDGVPGAEVAFPVSDGIIFELGIYARASGDVVHVEFDNARVDTQPGAGFTVTDLEQYTFDPQTSVNVFIPQGLNASKAVNVIVTSSNPTVAEPAGATGGSLTLTFPAGGANTQSFAVAALSPGAATFTLSGEDLTGVVLGQPLKVWVPPVGALHVDDDFEDGTVGGIWEENPAGFEAGTAAITVTEAGGTITLGGTGSVSYWGGKSMRTTQRFTASPTSPLVFEIDRVSHAGAGTATRAGVYITTPDRSQYVFFGENRGENGWQYNPGNTGGGTAIAAFNVAQFNDGGNHRMRIVADGQNVALYLDDVLGATTPFPVSSGLVFEFGVYTRAADDTVAGVFDNARIENLWGCVGTSVGAVVGLADNPNPSVTVRIPKGLNETQAVAVTVTTSDPAIAVPVGHTGGSLTLTFPADPAVSEQTFEVDFVAPGAATLTLTNDAGVCNGGPVQVVVGAAVVLRDDFENGTIDSGKWRLDDAAYETGEGTFTSVEADGVLTISGEATVSYWAGQAQATLPTFQASAAEPLVFQVDRVSRDQNLLATSTRTSVFITDVNRENFVFFADNVMEGGWTYNKRVGDADDNPTGSGINITAFDAPEFNDGGDHQMMVIADGTTARLYLDGVLGAEVHFPLSSPIIFEVGAYARAVGDTVVGQFDNVRILGSSASCVLMTPNSIAAKKGDAPIPVLVQIPAGANAVTDAVVTLTSSAPAVAAPAGATGGVLNVTFAAGGSTAQLVDIEIFDSGNARIIATNNFGACNGDPIEVYVPSVLIQDDFEDGVLNEAMWRVDLTPFEETGAATFTYLEQGGVMTLGGVVDTAYWPGIALMTVPKFNPTAEKPVIFEIDRVSASGVPTDTYEVRTGVWVATQDRANYVLFGDVYREGGWGINSTTGTGNPTGTPANIAAFDCCGFPDQGNNRIRVVVDGSKVSVFLDGVKGLDVPFPFADKLIFGFATYGWAANDNVTGVFDNVLVLGDPSSTSGLCNLNVFADLDGDLDVDQMDFGLMQVCLAGSDVAASPNCLCLDRDVDGDVDELDLFAFARCTTGPAIPFDRNNAPEGCEP
ncbi:MAG TPA: hypothetical protein PKY77_20625 [Phycisphaerae bacterium]|nr:hypothetical protein [Phycisphaerae bacterium]HRY70636.1 hypothetical protein [Phycisphaerae bacterium]HSA28951.1 hypothetical protein [Phycisphaerae bacterium]